MNLNSPLVYVPNFILTVAPLSNTIISLLKFHAVAERRLY